MTIEEAISKWRLLTVEQVIEEKKNNPEFREAIQSAAATARRFWEVDAAGNHKKQYGAGVPPARPNTKDYREFSLRELAPEDRPIKGAAFPS
jgi:hypothetical protein